MKYSLAFALLAVLVFSTSANANIIGVSCSNDGDGAITMNDWWSTIATNPTDPEIYMDESLHWAPAHAIVNITTDSELDPTARFTKEVDNETTSAWTGYVINVIKNGTFSITSATEPIGWDTPTIVQPTLQVSGIYAGDYLGTVSYSDSNPLFEVGIGGTGVFKLTTSFTGSSTFTLEQIPMNSVPEPATIILLLLSGLGGLAIIKRK